MITGTPERNFEWGGWGLCWGGGYRGMLLQWKVFEPSLSEIQFVVPNTDISFCIYTLHCNCNNTNATEKAEINMIKSILEKSGGEGYSPPGSGVPVFINLYLKIYYYFEKHDTTINSGSSDFPTLFRVTHHFPREYIERLFLETNN